MRGACHMAPGPGQQRAHEWSRIFPSCRPSGNLFRQQCELAKQDRTSSGCHRAGRLHSLAACQAFRDESFICATSTVCALSYSGNTVCESGVHGWCCRHMHGVLRQARGASAAVAGPMSCVAVLLLSDISSSERESWRGRTRHACLPFPPPDACRLGCPLFGPGVWPHGLLLRYHVRHHVQSDEGPKFLQ